MTTEQETGKGTPARRAVPKTGTRRSATAHQPKPRPRPDARPEADAKRSAAERERAEAAGRRPAGVRADAAAKAPATERVRAGEAGAPAAERVRAAGGKAPVAERARAASGKAPVVERTRPEAPGKRPVGGRTRAEATTARPESRRRPARRQRAPFVLLVVGLLCGGLVSLLLLNTMLAQDAITDATLREEIAVAKQENEKINQQYQLKTQPGVIADRAEKQGQHTDWDTVNSWSSAGDQASQVDTER
ncbi:hypothetical protein ACBJ59_06590 [Nonomuraea sp. MTCD27]|uniref:hypothetical protein n=1 Tax=Nonomuraea sp. MTCD27 TaxID=1676747 RepID=UPI0035C019DA